MSPLLIIAAFVLVALILAIHHHRTNPKPRNPRWASYKDEAWWVREKTDDDRYDPPSMSGP